MKHPLSEQTLKRHNYIYKSYRYRNNRGHPCEYSIWKGNEPLNLMVKYYKGRLLAEYVIQSN